MALGTFLDIDAPTAGIGFVNPYPLPAFPSGMESLHLLRRSLMLSSYNRLTLQQRPLEAHGDIFSENEIRANSGSEHWSDPQTIDLNDCTFALAVDLNEVVFPTHVAISSDYSESSRIGFRLTVQSSGSQDATLQLRLFNEGGFHSVNRPVGLPETGYLLVMFGADSSGGFIAIPGAGLIAEEAPSGDPGAPHDAGARYNCPGSSQEEGSVGYAAYARWTRKLSSGEIASAHAALVSWGADLGVEFI